MTQQPTITSNQNLFFRNCLRLRDNRKRRRSGQFLIDGTLEIVRAARAGVAISTLLVDASSALPAELRELVDSHPNWMVQPFGSPVFDRLSYGETSGQPIALANIPNWSLESLPLDHCSLVLVLDRIEKPGNLGACVRTAAACGVSGLILTRPICDPFNPNAIRSSRGTIFQIPIAEASPEEAMACARRLALPIYTGVADSDRSLWDISFEQGGFVVFGNETHGLDEAWLQQPARPFTIPMTGSVDCLNLSISAAVTLYEAVRQRVR